MTLYRIMAKFQEKLEARKLRSQGESIKAIANKLGVSTSSVSEWCEDITLSQEQILSLERHSIDPNYGKRLENSLRQRRERIEKTNRLRNEGRKEIGSLSKRELFLTGIALYWAEGFKKDSQVGFASLDPTMIKFFIKWLSECCGYDLKDLIFRVTVNASHAYRINEIQNYWSNILGVPLDSFQKPFFQRVKWKKVYDNPENYYGVLRIKVRKSTDFLRKISGWVEGLSQ